MMNSLTKDVVISSRIRLARNIKDVKFPIRMGEAERHSVLSDVCFALDLNDEFTKYDLSKMDNLHSLRFLEKHLISKELLDNKDIAGFCVNKNEDIVVMINEEDHIREQCFMKGYRLDEAFQNISLIDDIIINSLNVAYDEQLGFLTACPSNVGTGLRASCMLFLPALTMTNKISNIVSAVERVGLTVRGLYGEGSSADGYLYQISNQICLGKSEREIIDDVKTAVEKICEMENEAREILFNNKLNEIKDSTLRAFGILSNAYIMGTKEFTKLLSQLRLGKALGLIEFENENILEEIEVECQPASLTLRYGSDLTDQTRDKFRADYLSRALRNQRI